MFFARMAIDSVTILLVTATAAAARLVYAMYRCTWIIYAWDFLLIYLVITTRGSKLKIRIEHKYIGAALMQIAEHQQFTAINAMKIDGKLINNAFKINNNIGLFCKYASEPNGGNEYLFTFQSDHIDAVAKIAKQNDHAFIALVCIVDAEICCLSIEQFNTLIENRKKSAGCDEELYQILVTAEQGNSLRAYVNAAGKKGKIAGKKIVVTRKAFPNDIFGS
jgi:hypothetical protein